MSTATDLIAQLVGEEGPAAVLRARAARAGRSVVLCEGEDERVVAAALGLREMGLARPVLLGDPARVREQILNQGGDPGAFEVQGPDDPRLAAVAARILERRLHKGMQELAAKELASMPIFHGAGLVALGAVDAMVAGAVHSTAEVLRAGLWCVGPAAGIHTVSGSFLMLGPEGSRPLLFADSAVVVKPDEQQLVQIGLSSAETWRALFGTEPRLAALSFSTHGSSDHPAAARMARVAGQLREHGLQADGELQVDAALVQAVCAAKAPRSPVAGQADVLLFPDLQSGNIAYKLVQRLGHYRAIGPLVQGLARPVFDLSRGCDASEVVDTAVIAVLAAANSSSRSEGSP